MAGAEAVVNSTCGYDPHYRMRRVGGCGVWVGYMTREYPWGHPMIPMEPVFHNGIAWCKVCAADFGTRHLGHGIMVRKKGV